MRATLISWTREPLVTLQALWEASKTDDPLDDIIWRAEYDADVEPVDAREWFRGVMEQEVPIIENIEFIFMCEDVPISWREQAVRHRVGVSYGDNFIVDVIPEMDGSFWSQSHRLKDMSRFYDDGQFYVPESVANDIVASDVYRDTVWHIQEAYAKLVDRGIPAEDARNLLPLGATHRISMKINLRALKGIIGKRSCWILQAGIWAPIIESMIAELCEKIDPLFRTIVHPPCVTAGRFTECKFKVENERRVSGEDAHPVCPLYWMDNPFETATFMGNAIERRKAETQARIPTYARLWDQPRLAETWKWESK